MNLVERLEQLVVQTQRENRGSEVQADSSHDRGLMDDPSRGVFWRGYQSIFGFDFFSYIGKEIAKGIAPFFVLDVGCGAARFGKDLLDNFGERVVFFCINDVWIAPHIRRDRYIIGDAINPRADSYIMGDIPDGTFHLITCANCFEPDSPNQVISFLKVLRRKMAKNSLALIQAGRVYQNTARQLKARGMQVQTEKIPKSIWAGYRVRISS